MVRSLYSGVAGLTSHQTRMDVIGNNIANVNTYGFKASRTSFADIYYQAKRNETSGSSSYAGNNPSTVGYGVQVASIDKDMSMSSFQNTGRTLDLAISGDGFFITSGLDRNLDITNVRYTRMGNFGIDSDGNLVNANNEFVLGTVNTKREDGGKYSSTEMENLDPADTPSELDTINVNELIWDAFKPLCVKEYSDVDDADITAGHITQVANPNDNTQQIAADGNGNILYSVNGKYVNENGVVYNTKTGNYVDEEGNEYTFTVTPANGTDPAEYTYTSTGTTVSGGQGGVAAGTIYKYDKDRRYFKGDDGNGNDIFADMKMCALKYSDMDAFTVGSDGILKAQYSSTTMALARIEVATFDNVEGLREDGDTAFIQSSASGAANIKRPGDSGAGEVESSKLEMSNVNLANEFSDMIVTQRGFQANARIITTSDSMLEELVNLKR
jgi:flagellar hook protein FlgE